jgi:hypothetical protein
MAIIGRVRQIKEGNRGGFGRLLGLTKVILSRGDAEQINCSTFGFTVFPATSAPPRELVFNPKQTWSEALPPLEKPVQSLSKWGMEGDLKIVDTQSLSNPPVPFH